MSENRIKNLKVPRPKAFFLPVIEYLKDGELQAVILAGLCGVGAWVVISAILKIILWIFWPLLLTCGILTLMPSWRTTLAHDYVPAHLDTLKALGRKLTANFSHIMEK